MTTGEKIKNLRKQEKITQQELADKLGMTYVMISQYERGIRKPKIEMIKKIANALNVEYTELMCDDNECITEHTKTIGERIKVYREEKGLTQKELAKQADISENAVINYEKNKRTPSIDMIDKIAAALGVTSFDLLYNDSDKHKMAIEEKIKISRKKLKLSQKELADKTGVSRNAIINYENGYRKVPMEIFFKLNKVLNIPICNDDENLFASLIETIQPVIDSAEISENNLEKEACMNNFNIIYIILTELEKAMDYDEFDIEKVSAEKLKISENRLMRIWEMLNTGGYVNGVGAEYGTRDNLIFAMGSPRITLKGLEYLSENSLMKKAANMAKGIKEMTPML